MKIIAQKNHGVLDYLLGAAMMIAPWVFGFGGYNAASYVLVGAGGAIIAYSIATSYEYGLMALLPYRAHLVFDFAAGTFVAMAPSLFGFADSVYLPHTVFGMLALGASLLSSERPVIPTPATRAITRQA